VSQHPPRPKDLYALDPDVVWPPSSQPARQYVLMRPGQDLQAAYDAGAFLVETDDPNGKDRPLAIYGKPGFFAL
jgi:hypothetical protein